jgi:ABC-2 type transport system ATP-binding protein
MPQIVVENLVKTFKVAEREPGLIGAFKGLASRRYKTIRALDGIGFTLEKGELVGYIGPNGAGKSTTVKILSGILIPDSGRVEIMGRVPWRERIAHVGRIGVVFGQRTQLWWDLPVIESFDLLRDIYKVPDETFRKNRSELIELLRLSDFINTPVRQLSLGQRMRCDLAASLIHSPDILFLDEPTIGLDAVSKLAVRDFIKRVNLERGLTVILTTHDMDDIEALTNRVMVIGNGRLLSDGPLSDLRAKVTHDRHLILHLDDGDGAIPAREVSDPDAEVISVNGNQVQFRFDPEKIPAATLISRLASKYPVKDLFVENPPIEEIIAKLYEGMG